MDYYEGLGNAVTIEESKFERMVEGLNLSLKKRDWDKEDIMDYIHSYMKESYPEIDSGQIVRIGEMKEKSFHFSIHNVYTIKPISEILLEFVKKEYNI